MLEKLFGCNCGKTKIIKLEGAALQALLDYEATMKGLIAQVKAANEEMLATIQRETGTEAVDADSIKFDREYLDEFGIAFLKVPASHFAVAPEAPEAGEPEQPPNAAAA